MPTPVAYPDTLEPDVVFQHQEVPVVHQTMKVAARVLKWTASLVALLLTRVLVGTCARAVRAASTAPVPAAPAPPHSPPRRRDGGQSRGRGSPVGYMFWTCLGMLMKCLHHLSAFKAEITRWPARPISGRYL